MKNRLKKTFCFILVLALIAGIVPQAPAQAAPQETPQATPQKTPQATPKATKAAVSCKSLCSAALKATGGSKKLEYSSKSALDFGGFSSSDRKKVKSIRYVYDEKEVYSLCVVKAKNTAKAKSLLKTLKKYKKRNCTSDYLSDYSNNEKKVFKNAVCGRKGTYVWYIAMSTKKKTNTKGQSAIKKKL